MLTWLSLSFFFLLSRAPPAATLFPYTTLFRSRQLRSEILVGQRKHGDSVQRGVGRARLADGKSRHRDAFRHLHRGKQRVETLQRSEEHTSELQSPCNLVCRLLLEKKNTL